MGRLPDNFFSQPPAAAPVTPTVTQPAQPTAPAPQPLAVPKASQVALNVEEAGIGFIDRAIDKSISKIKPGKSVEDQTKQFGGPVGSPEYYQSVAPNRTQDNVVRTKNGTPIVGGVIGEAIKGNFATGSIERSVGETFGLTFPDSETWDSMTRFQKNAHILKAEAAAGSKLALRLPRELLKVPVRLGLSLYQPWSSLVQGKGNVEEPTTLPYFGKVPTYWQQYDEAKKTGLGTFGAAMSSTSTALGDVLIAPALAEAVVVALRPKTVIREFQPAGRVIETQKMPDGTYATRESAGVAPIREMQVRDGLGSRVVTQKEGSLSEYYALNNRVAREYGGSTSNTFMKITKAEIESNKVEVAVVQNRGGMLQRVKDTLVGRGAKVYEGDFSTPEVKLLSQVTDLGDRVPVTNTGQKVLGGPTLNVGLKVGDVQSLTPERIAEVLKKEFDVDVIKSSVHVSSSEPTNVVQLSRTLTDVELHKLSELTGQGAIPQYTDGVGSLQGPKAAEWGGKFLAEEFMDLNGRRIGGPTALSNVQEEAFKGGVLPRALKGFENAPVSETQIAHLEAISKVNEIHPDIANAVIRTITGKDLIGDLTQAEYVKASQVLSAINKADKYMGTPASSSSAARLLSPPRYWTRSIEESTGIPLYSGVYVPVEDAFRAIDVFRNTWRDRSRTIFGDYAGPKFGEERRLIKAYMEGNSEIIMSNPTLSTQVKTDLVTIATKLRPLYDELGQIFGIPTEVFLKDYQSHIQDIGGVYQLYKDGAAIPANLSFFAEFKRTGGIGVQVDDALALFDIYTNAGSNSLFLNPVLDKVSALASGIPQTLQNSVKSYVLEKMGYAGHIEQVINEAVPRYMAKLGINAPADIGRQIDNLIMDTTYSAGLGLSPSAIVKNLLQYPLLGYAKLGPKFSIEASKIAFTKEGMAEVREQGFLVKLGVPYGQELVNEAGTVGTLGQRYRNLTQGTLKGFSMSDAAGRSMVYWQGKLQWNDLVDKLKAGKVTLSGFEKELRLDTLNSLDRDIIVQRLVAGDQAGAFNHYIRDVIDDTMFPFRRGASSRITYGFAGKKGMQFGQWNIEFTHTMGKWLKSGQFDKVIRFGAASVALKRTFEDAFGLDITKWVGLHVLNPTLSPLLQAVQEGIGALGNAAQNNQEALNANQENLVRELKTLGIPAGVEKNRLQNFWKSYAKGPIGPDGQYGVYTKSGQLKYWTDFSGLFMGIFGFPTTQSVQEQNLQTDMRNARDDYSKAKKQAMEYLQQQEFDKANTLIEEYQLNITSEDLNSYFIPLNERTYKGLPASVKSQFEQRVFQ